MTRFVKVCTEFLPISIGCIIQVDIHAVLDADKKIWFNKAHKKELLELVLEKAKLRLLQSQAAQSLEKKERVSGQLRETTPEVLTGKNIKLGISFRKCGVRYNSVLAPADGLGDTKVYQPLSCFNEKLIVYSYPIDQSSETSDVATAASRHRIANENIGKNPSTVPEGVVPRIYEGKIASFTRLTNKNSSEAVDRNKSSVTPRPQLVSHDISEVDKFNLSAAKKKKKSTGEESSNKKNSCHLSQFKFRRTRAIQVLCHRASPSLKARLVQRRSRLLGLSCIDKEPEEENLQNKSKDATEKTSTDIGEKLDTHLGEKCGDICVENEISASDDKSVGVFEDRLRNISGKNLKEVLGKKSGADSMEKSENSKSLNLGNITLVQCGSGNELDEAITSSKTGDLEKSVATLQSEKNREEDCCLTSRHKKIQEKLEGKAVRPSKKREHDESHSVASGLPVSKKSCTKKSVEVELQSSVEFPRHRTGEVGQQCSSTMDKRSQVTGAEAVRSNFEARGNSKDRIRGNSNGEDINRHKSNREIRHVSAGDIRRCSSNDFTHSSNEIRGSRDKFVGSSISKDCETDWTSAVKGNLGKDITRTANNKSVHSSSESCSVPVVALWNTDTVLSNKTNQTNLQILDNDKDFRTTGLKRLPAQNPRRLATKKKRFEKLIEGINLDLSSGFTDDALTEKSEIDLGSAPSDRRPASFSTVDIQQKNSAISKHLSTSDADLGPFPLGCKKQIPDASTSATHIALEKDVRLSSSADNQPVAKRHENFLSSGSTIPSLCDAPASNLSTFSTSVTDSIGTADSQSCSENSVAMVANTRLSGCDVVMTKSPIQSDVITIESDDEGDFEAEIRAVRAVSDLTTSQLRHLVSCNETYLRKIFQGKIPCRRHQDYKAGKEKRRALSWNLPVGVFSDEQYSEILSSLKGLFCKKHEKYLDYLMMVLLPEMLVKIFMFIHDLSYEEAESRIEENAMELSQRHRFTF